MKFLSRPSDDTAGVILSEQRLEQIIDSLQKLQPQDQRRRVPRLGVQAEITLIPFAHGARHAPRQVLVHDISVAGVCIRDPHPMSPGQQFILQIPRDNRRPIEVLCTARHCRPSDQTYLIGAEYGVSWLESLAAAIAP